MYPILMLGAVAAMAFGITPAPADSDTSTVVHPEIVYAITDGHILRMDVYRPVEQQTYPAVITIHGGGWRSGGKEEWSEVAPQIAASGFVVFAINHRLAPPGGTWHAPSPIEDVTAALDWVEKNGHIFNADTKKIALMGSSSGAQIALQKGLRGGGVDAIASWSAPTAFDLLAGGHLSEVIDNYIGCGFSSCPQQHIGQSPAYVASSDDPPTYLAHSASEFVPTAQSRLLYARLTAVGVPVEFDVVPGALHGMQLAPHVLDDTLEFLRDHL